MPQEVSRTSLEGFLKVWAKFIIFNFCKLRIPLIVVTDTGVQVVAEWYLKIIPSSRGNSCGHFAGPEIFLAQIVAEIEPIEISAKPVMKMANLWHTVFEHFCKDLQYSGFSNLRRVPLGSRVSRLFEIFIFCKNWIFSLPWNFSDLQFSWVPLCYTDTNICNLNATILNANRYVNVYPPNSMGNDGIIVKPILARNFRHQRCRITQNEQNRTNTLRERCDWKSCPNLHRSLIFEFARYLNQKSILSLVPLMIPRAASGAQFAHSSVLNIFRTMENKLRRTVRDLQGSIINQ